MKILRHTSSLCNTCYREIAATIAVTPEGVTMFKRCPDHGEQESLVEKDPLFYTFVSSLRCPSIYDGHFVDVTRTCNLRCEYCFYPLEQKDPGSMFSPDHIINECLVNGGRAPFILTGGEPTMRDDLPELIQRIQNEAGPVELLTNGIKLADPAAFDAIVPLISSNGAASLNLSIHPETDKWRGVIELCRERKVRIESALIVVDSEEQFHTAIDLAASLSDVVMAFRIKAASKLWNEQKPDKIFVSDMIGWLDQRGGYQLITKRHNKYAILNVAWKNTHLMLVSWPDVRNVDLCDIACPPTYRARNGEVQNFLTAALINEGMSKGYLKGVQL